MRVRRGLVQLLIFALGLVGAELCCTWRLGVEGLESPTRRSRFDPTTGYRMGWLLQGELNRDGLRAPEVDGPPPPGRLRILCLGGSVTYGYGLASRESWPAVLASLLGGSTEVINGGQMGFGFWQQAALYFDVAERYRPQVVIALVGYNEYKNDLKGEIALPVNDLWRSRTWVDHTRTSLHRLATYRYFKARLHPPLPPQEGAGASVAPSATRDAPAFPARPASFADLTASNVRRFAGLLQRHHIGFVLGLEGLRSHASMLAFQAQGAPPDLRGHTPAEYDPLRAALVAAGQAMSFPVVDMGEVLRASGHDEDELFQPADIVHLTPRGAQLCAQAFERALRSLPSRVP